MTGPGWESSRLKRLSLKCAVYRGRLERLEGRAGRIGLSARDRRKLTMLTALLETAQADYEAEYRAWLAARDRADGTAGAELPG